MVVTTATDAQESMILFDPDIECALIDWNLENDPDHQAARLVLANIRRSKSNIPVFLFVTDNSAEDIRVDVLARVDGFIWILEDNMDAIVKDIILAVRRSNTPLLPPLFNADDVWKASCLTSRDGWNYFDFLARGWCIRTVRQIAYCLKQTRRERRAVCKIYFHIRKKARFAIAEPGFHASFLFTGLLSFPFLCLARQIFFCLFIADSAVNGLSRRLASPERRSAYHHGVPIHHMHGIEIVVGKSITWLFDILQPYNYLIPRLHGKNFYGPSPVNAHCIAGNGQKIWRAVRRACFQPVTVNISNGM